MTYLPTGQRIYFSGVDDPQKIKSIKPPFGYIGIVFLEELDQFAGQEEIAASTSRSCAVAPCSGKSARTTRRNHRTAG